MPNILAPHGGLPRETEICTFGVLDSRSSPLTETRAALRTGLDISFAKWAKEQTRPRIKIVGHWDISTRLSKGFPSLYSGFAFYSFSWTCCIHYGTFAAYDSLHPATRHPEASHANDYASRFSFSEAEGSAPLHHRVTINCLDTGWP